MRLLLETDLFDIVYCTYWGGLKSFVSCVNLLEERADFLISSVEGVKQHFKSHSCHLCYFWFELDACRAFTCGKDHSEVYSAGREKGTIFNINVKVIAHPAPEFFHIFFNFPITTTSPISTHTMQ